MAVYHWPAAAALSPVKLSRYVPTPAIVTVSDQGHQRQLRFYGLLREAEPAR